LLTCADREAQWRLWQSHWDNWQWRLLLRAIACRPLWRWGLREPGIALVPQEFDMAGYARARFDHAASRLHMRQLPFAWLLLTGTYHPDILPPYLTEAGHRLIRERIDRLTLRSASLQSTIAGMEPGQFEAASLSDYSSYCDTAAQNEVWRDLARGMLAGGRICERKFFNKTGTALPIAHGFKRDYAVEAQLDACDGALFYSFVVAVREGA
jgi:S-adenosylmethionine-diacylglycerol 3-amino-3-carboxypropyl transferase